MDSVFIAARAGVDENAAAPSATVAGASSASLRVIVMGTSLSCETRAQAWRGGEEMSRGGRPRNRGLAARPGFGSRALQNKKRSKGHPVRPGEIWRRPADRPRNGHFDGRVPKR